jgi:hypothetical protein
MEHKFEMYNATINRELYGLWMIHKDLPMFQNVPGDVNVFEISSLSDEGEGSVGKRKKSISNERGDCKRCKGREGYYIGAPSKAMQEHY